MKFLLCQLRSSASDVNHECFRKSPNKRIGWIYTLQQRVGFRICSVSIKGRFISIPMIRLAQYLSANEETYWWGRIQMSRAGYGLLDVGPEMSVSSRRVYIILGFWIFKRDSVHSIVRTANSGGQQVLLQSWSSVWLVFFG